MDDFSERWDDNEVQIEDLGAPAKGFARLIFSFGANIHARLRVMRVALILAVSLLAILSLPGSSLLRLATSGPRSSSTRSLGECYVVANSTASVIWRLHSSTPIPSGSVIRYMCNNGSLFRIAPGNAGPGASEDNTPQP